MDMTNKKFIGLPWDIWIQIALAIAFFFGNAVSRDHEIHYNRIWLYVNYLLTAFVINYCFLPRYFYQRKYLQFAIGVLIIIIVSILIEEFWLEKMIFPNTKRAENFPGLMYNFLFLFPILMIFVGFKFAWDVQYKETRLQDLEQKVTESQLQFLNSQINPHFLFNNLNNLYSYALDNSPKTPKIILELSSILRYMLYDCREKYVPLSKEIQCLDDFIKLQSLQIEERGSIRFDVQGEYSHYRIAPLILIVFVENCFKHSTSSMTEHMSIDVQLKVEKEVLIMDCVNKYSETDNTNDLSNGIGLDNVKQRLSILYPDMHTLQMGGDGNNFKVHLEIKLT